MGEIIDLQNDQRFSTGDTVRPDREERQTRMRQHLKHIVKQLSSDGVIRAADLVRLAENIRAITRRIRKQYRLTQETIYSVTVRNATQGTNASKNARYYEKKPGHEDKRTLVQDARKYLKLLNHIASLTGEDSFDLVEEAFSETSFLRQSSNIYSEVDHVEALVDLVRSMSKSIEAACPISQYFKNLQKCVNTGAILVHGNGQVI